MTESMSYQERFISNLIKKAEENDKEFKEFIDENLFPMKSKSNSIDVIKTHLHILKAMDSTQQLLVKARAKHFEETNDPSKYFPSLIAMFVVLVPIYTLLNSVDKESYYMGIIMLTNIIAFLAFIVFVFKSFLMTIRMRSTAVYFNSLVTNIEYNGNEEKKTS